MHPILDPGSQTFWRRVEETRALQLAFVFYLQRHLPSLARLRQVLAVHFLKLFSCHHPFVDGNTCRYSSFCLAQYRTPQMVGCFQVDFISSHPSLLVSNFFFYARLRSNSLLQQGCLRYDCRLPLHCWCHKYRFGRFGILLSASRFGANRRVLAPRDSRLGDSNYPAPAFGTARALVTSAASLSAASVAQSRSRNRQ